MSAAVQEVYSSKAVGSLPICSDTPAVAALTALKVHLWAEHFSHRHPHPPPPLTLLWFYPTKGLEWSKQMVSMVTVRAREYAANVCLQLR